VQPAWDIFVSYRHVADESDDHWVTNFCKGLETRINDQLGEKPRIFQDKAALRAGDEWREELDRVLESVPIFLAIISQSYFHSQVCRQEMDLRRMYAIPRRREGASYSNGATEQGRRARVATRNPPLSLPSEQRAALA
jgi:TIR domain